MKNLVTVIIAIMTAIVLTAAATSASEPIWDFREDFNNTDITGVFSENPSLRFIRVTPLIADYSLEDGKLKIANHTTISSGLAGTGIRKYEGTTNTLVADDFKILHVSCKITSLDMSAAKFFVMRYMYGTTSTTDLFLQMGTNGNFQHRGLAGGAITDIPGKTWAVGQEYKIDLIIDMSTGVKRIFIDDDLALETSNATSTTNGNLMALSHLNIEFTPVRVDPSDTTSTDFVQSTMLIDDLFYKYYDVNSELIYEYPYVKGGTVSFDDPVFYDYDGTEMSTAPYDLKRISLNTKGRLRASSVTYENVQLLTSDDKPVPVAYIVSAVSPPDGAVNSASGFSMDLDARLKSNQNYRIKLLPGTQLLDGTELGKEIFIDFRVGPKPFDVQTAAFIVDDAPSSATNLSVGQNVSASMNIVNDTGSTRTAVVVLLLYDKQGRISRIASKTDTVPSNGTSQLETEGVTVVSEGSYAEALVIDGWSSRLAVSDTVFK